MKFWTAMAFTPPEHYVPLAKALDEAGMHGVMLSDHIFYPRALASRYPYSPYPDGRPIWEPETAWPDVWVMIGAMAAVTTRLRLSTNIYIAPARDIFTVAKLVGTASVISGGRVDLGLAAGWMKEEFDQLGQSYANRGKRLNEMMDALRVLWGGGWVEHHGEFYDFGLLQIEPAPVVKPQIWSGGHSDAALRRAARHADGWIGNAYTEEDAALHIDKLQALRVAEGRADLPFEIVIGLYAMPSKDLYKKWEAKGVTGFMTVPWYTDERSNDAGVADAQGAELTRKVDAVFRFAEQWLG